MKRIVTVCAALLLLMLTVPAFSAETTPWQAAYYPNPSFEDNPLILRAETKIESDWGDMGPAPWFPSDNFSVRWTRDLTVDTASLYRLSARADDGVRILVDGEVLLDAGQSYGRLVSAEIELLPGTYAIAVEYVETVGNAFVSAQVEQVVNGDWVGTFYNNIGLRGEPQATLRTPSVNFNWGTGSPGFGVSADRFTARWTRSVTVAEPTTYCLRASAKDGVRVLVNGERVINAWASDGSVRVAEVKLDPGEHDFAVEYVEREGTAYVYFNYLALQDVRNTTTGKWRATAYNSRDLSGCPVATFSAETPSFDYGTSAPQPTVARNNWSMRWIGGVMIDQADTYCFSVRADDGARVWVGSQLLIDGWARSRGKLLIAPIDLSTGFHPVRIEYFETAGEASLDFNYFPLSPLTDVYATDSWHANYYNGRSIEGCPTFTEKIDKLNVSWGLGSPDENVDVNAFSATYTKRVNFPETTTYCFETFADHGLRVFIDGERLINSWTAQGKRNIASKFLTAGEHDILVEYNELRDVAYLNFKYFPVRDLYQGLEPPEPDMWRGVYFSNRNLSGCPTLVRSDASIDFDWGTESPSPELPANNFSVRWQRGLQLAESGPYCLSVQADQGVRVSVNGEMVIDEWRGRRDTSEVIAETVEMRRGYNDLRVEYYETNREASINFNYVAGACDGDEIATAGPSAQNAP